MLAIFIDNCILQSKGEFEITDEGEIIQYL